MKSTKYWLEVEQNGEVMKVRRAKKLVGVNQYKRTWRPTDAREAARLVNRSKLVIK